MTVFISQKTYKLLTYLWDISHKETGNFNPLN